ncbi:hypothetical protein V5R04_09115 [Jonesiaceae bacterium BS-20]|uniref:Uncharacterized protein n=1 Tax=Jonesiaceae bacterium BS-20 TaxID=3120821 RepID=A0AAU7DQD9_9MICO
MIFDISPNSRALGSEEARKLDDDFFLSNPLAQFSSRIAMLLEAHGSETVPTPENEKEFFSTLGLTSGENALKFNKRDRQTQVAIDSLALRHQVAEALARIIHATSVAEPRDGDSRCVWLQLADGPLKTSDVVGQNAKYLNAKTDRLLQLLFPVGTNLTKQHFEAAESARSWINHSVHLLTNDELSANAANNKMKHGLAVSARDDIRIELFNEKPADIQRIPVSAFGKGKTIPLFDQPMLSYLNRPSVKPKMGWEVASLRVDLPVALAEAWMMANIHAAIFHVAALRHFEGKLPDGVGPYPSLVIGSSPEKIIGNKPIGYRSTITLPPDGTTPPRPPGLLFHSVFIPMSFTPDSGTEGTIVAG